MLIDFLTSIIQHMKNQEESWAKSNGFSGIYFSSADSYTETDYIVYDFGTISTSERFTATEETQESIFSYRPLNIVAHTYSVAAASMAINKLVSSFNTIVSVGDCSIESFSIINTTIQEEPERDKKGNRCYMGVCSLEFMVNEKIGG